MSYSVFVSNSRNTDIIGTYPTRAEAEIEVIIQKSMMFREETTVMIQRSSDGKIVHSYTTEK